MLLTVKTKLISMAVTILCPIKKIPMNSLSPKDEGRRTSPRKSAGRMPHYFLIEEDFTVWRDR